MQPHPPKAILRLCLHAVVKSPIERSSHVVGGLTHVDPKKWIDHVARAKRKQRCLGDAAKRTSFRLALYCPVAELIVDLSYAICYIVDTISASIKNFIIKVVRLLKIIDLL